MLYSQIKERENRFLLSLKIATPFVLVVIFLIYMMIKNDNYKSDDIILITILILTYVYYIVYLIYFGFKKSLIDPISGVFLRAEILKILSKKKDSKKISNIVLLKITNFVDINDRYGHKNGDEILKKFINKFSNFMSKEGYENLPIGSIIAGSFVFGINCEFAKLNHIINIFKLKLLNKNINDIEVKMDFSILPSDYDNNVANTINALFYTISHKDDEDNKEQILNLDDFEKSIYNAIDNENYGIKSQLIKSIKGNVNYENYISRLISSEYKDISKSKIINIIFANQYDIKYDINLIKFLSKNIYFKDIKNKIFIEIFPTTLRNSLFKKEILKLIDSNLIDPKKIVFEFSEYTAYDEIHRFGEIIDQFKDLGFNFALNKFGSNNASFEYFKYLNIDFIIYDMEYNKNLNDIKIHKFFHSLNLLCKELKIKTIIRFVDKETLYNDIKEAGIDFAQGFYIQKPTEIKKINS